MKELQDLLKLTVPPRVKIIGITPALGIEKQGAILERDLGGAGPTVGAGSLHPKICGRRKAKPPRPGVRMRMLLRLGVARVGSAVSTAADAVAGAYCVRIGLARRDAELIVMEGIGKVTRE